jgi:acyl carrier protein
VQIRETLRNFVTENFLYGRGGDLKDDDSFLDSGIIDSTGVLELVSFIEESFGIKVQDSELVPENLDSIQRVTEFVERRRGTSNGVA